MPGLHIIAGTSYGNDSCALIQWLHENGFQNVSLCYYNTGWHASWWPARVERMERWAQSLGYRTLQTESIGMVELVRKRKGWPRNGMQFCTTVLKVEPAKLLKEQIDPLRQAICAVGVRRAESEKRSQVEEWEEDSPLSNGRMLWRPLYAHSDEQRDALLARAGIKPLAHRSRECSPCVNEGRDDLLQTEPAKIDLIANLEQELGFTGTGKPRVMFRPARKQGATGIREVMDWARSEPRKYTGGSANVTIDDEPAGGCDDEGYCGI